jgi:hypothetical protein
MLCTADVAGKDGASVTERSSDVMLTATASANRR